MTAYYQEVMELWKAGKFFDAISRFSDWLSKGLLSEKETEIFKRDLSRFWKLLEIECEENPIVMFNLYQMLIKKRKWNDEILCKKLRISRKAIEEIKSGNRPSSTGVGFRMLYELFLKWLYDLCLLGVMS